MSNKLLFNSANVHLCNNSKSDCTTRNILESSWKHSHLQVFKPAWKWKWISCKDLINCEISFKHLCLESSVWKFLQFPSHPITKMSFHFMEPRQGSLVWLKGVLCSPTRLPLALVLSLVTIFSSQRLFFLLLHSTFWIRAHTLIN